jgi:hypothetical protein
VRSPRRHRLRKGATQADAVCVLHGQDVRRILETAFGVLRSLLAVYDLLHRLGFGPLRPRPRHPKGDPAEQQEFQKRSPTGSPTPPGPVVHQVGDGGVHGSPRQHRRATPFDDPANFSRQSLGTDSGSGAKKKIRVTIGDGPV